MQLAAQQRKVVVAELLGWTLDAFDFFILVLTLPAIGVMNVDDPVPAPA